MVYRPIAEYSLIGNDDRCALVDRDGSVDWCCFPHVAAPSVFARLLDPEVGGHFAVRPTDTYESDQGYVDRTNVLRTTFETRSGRATLTDFMPVGDRDRNPGFQRSLYRRLRCEEGRLTVAAEFKPRLDYARSRTTVERRGGHVVASDGDEDLHLQVHGPLDLRATDGRAVGTATLEAEETVWLVLQHDHVAPVDPSECRRTVEETAEYWRGWVEDVEETAASFVGDDPWLDEVVRSALVLKLLINEGSGAIYAAPTTSLPEEFGGDRNWDYRYNWLRDAKFTVQALFNLGRRSEARDYFEWFQEIGHEDSAEIQPVYGVHGERDLTEYTLDHLAGYQHSAPVRVGNVAATQRQLDVYGAIVQGFYETLLHDGEITGDDWASIRSIVDHVCDVWDERDSGIWEFRSDPKHYVHSKLLCWVALSRGIALAEQHDRAADVDRWRDERAAVRAAIERRGYSESAGSFVQHFETDDVLDATCLLIPIYGFLPPDDPRVQGTIDAVLDELLTEGGLVERTTGGDVDRQSRGAFLFCSFWLVDALVLADRVERARDLFTDVLAYVEPPYLLPERIDPSTGEFLGNYPQAFSHIGLINSAIYLASATDDDVDLNHDPQVDDADVDPMFRP